MTIYMYKPVSISHPPPTKRSLIKVPGFISLHYSKLNCIKRSPVFSSRGRLFSGPNEIFSLLPLFNGHFVKNYNCNAKDSLCMTFSGLYLPIFWHKGYAVLAKLEAKMAGHRPTFVFALSCTESKSRSTKTQKRTKPIYIHLDRTSLVNKGFIIWRKRTLSCGQILLEICLKKSKKRHFKACIV